MAPRSCTPTDGRHTVGVQFPFELLDIYVGAWLSTFVPHHEEKELHLSDERKLKYPEGTRFLRAALDNAWVRARGKEANMPPRDPKHADKLRTSEPHREDAIVFEWLLEQMH